MGFDTLPSRTVMFRVHFSAWFSMPAPPLPLGIPWRTQLEKQFLVVLKITSLSAPVHNKQLPCYFVVDLVSFYTLTPGLVVCGCGGWGNTHGTHLLDVRGHARTVDSPLSPTPCTLVELNAIRGSSEREFLFVFFSSGQRLLFSDSVLRKNAREECNANFSERYAIVFFDFIEEEKYLSKYYPQYGTVAILVPRSMYDLLACKMWRAVDTPIFTGSHDGKDVVTRWVSLLEDGCERRIFNGSAVD